MSTPTPDRILRYYESIGTLSKSMVQAARERDWETLAAAEGICATLIAQIDSVGDAPSLLTCQGRRRRMAILRDILDDDAKIRAFTEPSLDRLDHWLAVRDPRVPPG